MQTEHWHCDWCRQNTGTVTDAKGPLAYVHDCMVQPERWHCDWCKYKTRTYGTKHCDWCRQNAATTIAADRMLVSWVMQTEHWYYDYHVVFLSMGSGDSSVVRALDSWLKSRRFESLQERLENFFFFSWVSFLCWLLFRYPFHPRVTAVARKRSRPFCQKCRWQVTTRMHLTYVAYLHEVTLCMVV